MANIFKIIKLLDILDSDFNKGHIDWDNFSRQQKVLLENFKHAFDTIGIWNATSRIWYGTLRGHINESPFDFIISKMYNKFKENENEVSSLTKAFQHVMESMNDLKGLTLLSDCLKKVIGFKNPIDSNNIDQTVPVIKKFVEYQQHHPDKKEASESAFTYLQKDGSSFQLREENKEEEGANLHCSVSLKDYITDITLNSYSSWHLPVMVGTALAVAVPVVGLLGKYAMDAACSMVSES